MNKELTGEEYSSLTPKEMVEWLNASLETLHKFKQNAQDKDKFFLQFAFDVLNATRNGLLENLSKEEPRQQIITSKSARVVRATSSAFDKCEKIDVRKK